MTLAPGIPDEPTPARPFFRQWVDDTRTISFREWEDGTVEYAIRGSQASHWGEWILLSEINVREVAP